MRVDYDEYITNEIKKQRVIESTESRGEGALDHEALWARAAKNTD